MDYYAVIITDEGKWQALVKSDFWDRITAVKGLCDLHLTTLKPDSISAVVLDPKLTLKIGMHPDRDAIIDRLRALEFPLPSQKRTLKVSYTVTKRRR